MSCQKRKGRPPSRNWDEIKGEIELLIRAGYGVPALSRHYDASHGSIVHQLKRMGLTTKWQKEK